MFWKCSLSLGQIQPKLTEAKATLFCDPDSIKVAPIGNAAEATTLFDKVASWFVVQYGIAAVELQYDQQKRQSQSTQAQL